MTTPYEIRPIGYVESPLVDRESASKQGFEGAPDACLVFNRWPHRNGPDTRLDAGGSGSRPII
jgi:hypothetical protein